MMATGNNRLTLSELLVYLGDLLYGYRCRLRLLETLSDHTFTKP